MKYVYLFELDSVRKTDDEIIEGQVALYNELVRNGNVVVLTYNQLVDSRGFFSLLSNPEYYENLVALFKKGAIRISQYGENRTITQYLMNKIDDDKYFVYSALPLKYSQKRLTALVKRSLMYSDLSEIHSYLSGKRSSEELKDLFVEVGSEMGTTLSLQEMNAVLENLYWILSIILRLSFIHDIYIPPRNTAEYSHLKMRDYLDNVIQFEMTDDQFWKEAVEIVRGLNCFGSNDRSIYLEEIKEKSTKDVSHNIRSYQYAEIIVSLCYNYSCEISICNISKHYNVTELDSDNLEMTTFKADFFSRFKQYWKNGMNAEGRFLSAETNQYIKFQKYSSIPDFSEAIRVNQFRSYASSNNCAEIPRYEFELTKQHKAQRRSAIKTLLKQGAVLIVCILIACVLELIFQVIQGVAGRIINFDSTVWNIIETLIFLFVAEGVTNLIAKRICWLSSLSDSLNGIWAVMKDSFHAVFQKSQTYTNECNQYVTMKETASCVTPIEFVTPYAIKKYINYRKINSGMQDVAQSTEYQLAAVENPEVVRDLIRNEELYHIKYGLIYESPYNILMVDPIVKRTDTSLEKTSIISYERILPAVDNGVVLVTMHKGKFILIEQFRHAIRKRQLCFPRGNAEIGVGTAENIKRELAEELNTEYLKNPIFLGTVVADSGLSAGTALVYLIEIGQYEANSAHEGIIKSIELTKEEFILQIQNGSINDGFTLSAFSLLESHAKNSGALTELIEL